MKKTMSSKQSIQNSQQGIISIMMTIVMMLVISLIVLGLAQISRREQRVSTDNQLSAQAFYAAESGVNDVVNILRSNPSAPSKTACNDTTMPYDTLVPTISTGVSYSCVLVDTSPKTLFGKAGPTPSVYSLVSPSSINSLTFSWGPGDGQAGNIITGCPATLSNVSLFPAASWTCPYAVLRVDLVDASSLNRNALFTNNQTAFLIPRAVGTLGASGVNLRGATCNIVTQICSYTFTGLSSNKYYARVSAIYTNGALTICGNSCTAGFEGQANVDVTGKAQDVLRRVRITVDLTGGNQNRAAQAAILSGDSVCKRFKINDNGTATGDYTGYVGCN